MHAVRSADDARELDQIARQNEERAKADQTAFEQSMEIQEFYRQERDRIRQEEYESERAAEEQRQKDLADIERRGIKSRADWEKATTQQRAKSLFGDIASLTARPPQQNAI